MLCLIMPCWVPNGSAHLTQQHTLAPHRAARFGQTLHGNAAQVCSAPGKILLMSCRMLLITQKTGKKTPRQTAEQLQERQLRKNTQRSVEPCSSSSTLEARKEDPSSAALLHAEKPKAADADTPSTLRPSAAHPSTTHQPPWLGAPWALLGSLRQWEHSSSCHTGSKQDACARLYSQLNQKRIK